MNSEKSGSATSMDETIEEQSVNACVHGQKGLKQSEPCQRAIWFFNVVWKMVKRWKRIENQFGRSLLSKPKRATVKSNICSNIKHGDRFAFFESIQLNLAKVWKDDDGSPLTAFCLHFFSSLYRSFDLIIKFRSWSDCLRFEFLHFVSSPHSLFHPFLLFAHMRQFCFPSPTVV